ncbi:hypothetical protein PIIN_05554 [Serendipita indica DSM 11827]|uniref:Uncharacterized protein n=1 Tax=Serendipita indica (strain DSM 11827) TaxID=1109443 RepID=G4TJX4_SERID|nr:hypothetical protein PIIN_05554 [Serendipita indica DSM 11827]
MSSNKVVIVGAGWNGLTVAKTYLQVDPTISLTVLEAERSLGGTWSADRVYPELHTQAPYGAYESCDLSMTRPPNAKREPADFIPSNRVHEYLQEFATKFNIANKIRYNVSVKHVQRHEDGVRWTLTVLNERGEQETIVCDKLVISTGLTSLPTIPDIPSESFEPPTFHSRFLGARYEEMRSPEIKVVTVYGGGKSAYDAVHAATKAGKQVQWVIRTSGAGMGAMATPEFGGSSISDIIFTPAMDYNYPHPLRDTWWDRFFHSGKNWFGYWLHWTISGLMSRVVTGKMGYDENDAMRKLKPDVVDRVMYWHNGPLLAVPTMDILDKVRRGDGITIYRADITKLSGRHVHLADQTTLTTDMLIYATGYSIHQPIFSEQDAYELGLPVQISHIPSLTGNHDAQWPTQAMEEADKEVLAKFPRLSNPPVEPKKPTYTQYRLYRSILPFPLMKKRDRSLTFVGYLQGAAICIIGDVSALWAVAWMTGKLDIERDMDEMEKECDLLNAFIKRRYLNAGREIPIPPFEWMTILNYMLEELEVSLPEAGALTPRYPIFYRGIVEKWLAVHS